MNNFDFKEWRQILGIVPVYDNFGGNSTIIYLLNGDTFHDQFRTKTVLKHLAEFLAVDLSALRKKSGSMVGRKSSTPLPLRNGFTLIPLRTRQPMSKDQGSLGYMVYEQIKEIKSLDKHRTLIYFNNNFSIECLQGVESVELLLNHAKIISSNIKEYSLEVKENSCNSVYGSCSVLKVLLNTLIAETNNKV